MNRIAESHNVDQLALSEKLVPRCYSCDVDIPRDVAKGPKDFVVGAERSIPACVTCEHILRIISHLAQKFYADQPSKLDKVVSAGRANDSIQCACRVEDSAGIGIDHLEVVASSSKTLLPLSHFENVYILEAKCYRMASWLSSWRCGSCIC